MSEYHLSLDMISGMKESHVLSNNNQALIPKNLLSQSYDFTWEWLASPPGLWIVH
jgi:hypothetical protein